MLAQILYCLLAWCNVAPLDAPRHNELATLAADVASTDATTDEAELLVAICVHESHCHLRAVGDGGRARGPWQIHGRDTSAAAALARIRWSMAACGNLSFYAGCGRCGACPDGLLDSLMDPTLPRR